MVLSALILKHFLELISKRAKEEFFLYHLIALFLVSVLQELNINVFKAINWNTREIYTNINHHILLQIISHQPGKIGVGEW